MNKKKKIVWFCGLPEQVRQEVFSDMPFEPSCSWSWVVGHLPPPNDIDLHIVCGDRRLTGDVTRTWNGVTFHLVKVPRGGPYFLYEGWAMCLARKSRELNPDIVHGWGTECAFGIATLRAAPQKHVIGIQGILSVTWPVMRKDLPTCLCVLNEKRVLRASKHCVAESFYSKKTVSRFTPAIVDVVPQPLRNDFRVTSLGARDEKIMVYLGVLAHRKGIYDAIAAFLDVESDWKLVCIGEFQSVADRNRLASILKEKDSANRVLLAGVQSSQQIIDWFRRSPVLLLPTYTDTGPTALKEALAMGLWPVCYDNTGPHELISKYGAGSLVPTGDIAALTEMLRQVLGKKPWKDQSRMRQIAETIRMDLSPAVVWKALEKVYDDIAE
jgi:glycosyltransferase involved in cell wall biosynthesis